MNTALAYYGNQIEHSEFLTMEELRERFFDYLGCTNKVTEKSYDTALKCFFTWMLDNGITRPQRADIKAYVNYLKEPHRRQQRADRKPTEDNITLSAGTQVRYLRAVKMFFKWTFTEGLYPDISAGVKGAKVKSTTQHRDAFEKSEVLDIMNSIDRSTVTGKRDYAMMLLSVTCGLRIIEMQRADIKDIELMAGKRVLYIQGKGHDEKDDYKEIIAPVYDAVCDYLEARRSVSKNEPLFTNQSNRIKGERLSEPSVAKIIKDRIKAAGYDSHRLSAHSLRHTSVTALLMAGATLQEAQAHARHSKPETTMIYAHNLDKQNCHSEQIVYDYLFGEEPPASDTDKEFMKIYGDLSQYQKEQLLNIAKAMKG